MFRRKKKLPDFPRPIIQPTKYGRRYHTAQRISSDDEAIDNRLDFEPLHVQKHRGQYDGVLNGREEGPQTKRQGEEASSFDELRIGFCKFDVSFRRRHVWSNWSSFSVGDCGAL